MPNPTDKKRPTRSVVRYSPMHLPKLSFWSRPLPLVISSKRRSTAFHPSFPPEVLSRNRSPRSPTWALDCIRVIRPGRIPATPSGTFIDTRDANCRTPDASRDGCFMSPRANPPGGGGSLPAPAPGDGALPPPSTAMPSSGGDRRSPYPAMPRPDQTTAMPPAGSLTTAEAGSWAHQRVRCGVGEEEEEGDRDGG